MWSMPMGGIYSIQTTNPTRWTVFVLVRVGNAVIVSVGLIVATSVAKCGLFGCQVWIAAGPPKREERAWLTSAFWSKA
jgi:hypothetical protein